MGAAPTPRAIRWGFLVVAVSVPLALGLESLLRHWILPPDFEYLRQACRPVVTPLVWGLAVLAVLVDLAAYRLHLVLTARVELEAPVLGPDKTAWKRFEALMIATSVAQSPGLLATFAFMAGASLGSVLAAIGVSTAGVLAIGVHLRPSP